MFLAFGMTEQQPRTPRRGTAVGVVRNNEERGERERERGREGKAAAESDAKKKKEKECPPDFGAEGWMKETQKRGEQDPKNRPK